MDAKELHDAYVKYGLAAIVGPDGVSPIVLRALSLLASAEGSSEEIVLELGGFVDFLHERGHDGDAQLVDDARARIVSDEREKERLRAELKASEMCLATHAKQLGESAVELRKTKAELASVKALIASPPRHKYWGAGEADCPSEIKAANGELHTLRCKVCGLDNPRDEICRSATQEPSQHVAWLRYKIGKDGAATTVHLCNSDDDGAFKVYRAAHPKD